MIRQRLGGRRDSAAQANGTSPPSTPPPLSKFEHSATAAHSISAHPSLSSTLSPSISTPAGSQRRRRSSLAQLTDILREWSGSNASTKRQQKPPLNRRETLADLARSLPWSRTTTTTANTSTENNGTACQHNHASHGGHGRAPSLRKRRESSADSGIKSMRSRRESHTSEFHRNVSTTNGAGTASGNNWLSRERSPNENNTDTTGTGTGTGTGTSTDVTRSGSRRDSGESNRSGRRDSTAPPAMHSGGGSGAKVVGVTAKKRRDSLTVADLPGNYRQEQRPSTSSTDSTGAQQQHLQQLFPVVYHVDTGCQALPPPTIIMSSVTPPATSPTAPPKAGRRDSTTQCGRLQRRDSRASPERPRLQRLQRQATAFDESCLPVAGGNSRRGSGPALSPDGDESERRARRDSLSPDSASRGGRRDSRAHLSPDRSRDRDGSPRRRTRLRRQSSSAGRQPRSPESSSCCSSR